MSDFPSQTKGLLFQLYLKSEYNQNQDRALGQVLSSSIMDWYIKEIVGYSSIPTIQEQKLVGNLTLGYLTGFLNRDQEYLKRFLCLVCDNNCQLTYLSDMKACAFLNIKQISISWSTPKAMPISNA